MCECNQICVWNERHIGCQKPIDELCPLSNVAPTEKPLTNADRIRAMSDAELADYFSKTFCHGYGKPQFIEWLKQPAEEE